MMVHSEITPRVVARLVDAGMISPVQIFGYQLEPWTPHCENRVTLYAEDEALAEMREVSWRDRV